MYHMGLSVRTKSTQYVLLFLLHWNHQALRNWFQQSYKSLKKAVCWALSVLKIGFRSPPPPHKDIITVLPIFHRADSGLAEGWAPVLNGAQPGVTSWVKWHFVQIWAPRTGSMEMSSLFSSSVAPVLALGDCLVCNCSFCFLISISLAPKHQVSISKAHGGLGQHVFGGKLEEKRKTIFFLF